MKVSDFSPGDPVIYEYKYDTGHSVVVRVEADFVIIRRCSRGDPLAFDPWVSLVHPEYLKIV